MIIKHDLKNREISFCFHRDQNFISKVVELITHILLHQNLSTSIFHSISVGLELLVLNFSLSAQERTLIINSASNRSETKYY